MSFTDFDWTFLDLQIEQMVSTIKKSIVLGERWGV